MPILPELLAPAGDLISLQAALDAGADAVYLGVDTFNMRRMATRNFTLENLPEAAGRCRERGVRLYLTLNALIYQHELDALDQVVAAAKPFIDAAIVADWAVVAACRRHGVPFHISTQMSCSNAATARFLGEQGASRVVLARECTLEEVGLIARESGMPVEVFVHGAICVAVSGRCFLSHHAYGKSCNRGECHQPCRREYIIREVREGDGADAEFIVGQNYALSARDLCSLPFLDRLVAAGVSSLKIEGRARNADYVSAVVRAYRAGLTAIADGRFTPELAEALTADCAKVYHRAFGVGLYHGRPAGADQFTDNEDNEATEKKRYLGVVVNYYPQAKMAHLLVHDNTLRVGDNIVIHGPTTGVVALTIAALRRDDETPESVSRGAWCTFPCPTRVRIQDKVFLVTPAAE